MRSEFWFWHSGIKTISLLRLCIKSIINWALLSRGGSTWRKHTIRLSHYMRLVPHSTALTRWFYHPFSLAKIPSNYLKKCQITSPQPFLVVDLWIQPLFLDFPIQVQLVNPPKTEKWLRLLVDFGQVPPGTVMYIMSLFLHIIQSVCSCSWTANKI